MSDCKLSLKVAFLDPQTEVKETTTTTTTSSCSTNNCGTKFILVAHDLVASVILTSRPRLPVSKLVAKFGDLNGQTSPT